VRRAGRRHLLGEGVRLAGGLGRVQLVAVGQGVQLWVSTNANPVSAATTRNGATSTPA
jgi:hypothetical protein